MKIYTDGSCRMHTDRYGGWAFVVIENNKVVYQESGIEEETTNNIMELVAIERALKYAMKNSHRKIIIVTDSQYCCEGYNSWCFGWEKNNWEKHKGLPVLNKEYWERIHSMRSENISIEWVRGHNGDKWNEYCDKLTRGYSNIKATKKYVSKKEPEPLYPLFFEGKYWNKEDCYDMFVALYKDKQSLDNRTSVYVSDGDRMQPDGTWVF